MSDSGGTGRFKERSADDQNRYRQFGQQMVGLVRKYAVPIVFATPPRIKRDINSASGAVLKLDCGYFVLTAHHVLDSYRKRLQSGENLIHRRLRTFVRAGQGNRSLGRSG